MFHPGFPVFSMYNWRHRARQWRTSEAGRLPQGLEPRLLGSHPMPPGRVSMSFLFCDSVVAVQTLQTCSKHHIFRGWLMLAHHFYCFNQNAAGEKKNDVCCEKPPCFSPHSNSIRSARMSDLLDLRMWDDVLEKHRKTSTLA